MRPRPFHREHHISPVPALQLLQNMGWHYVWPDEAAAYRAQKRGLMQQLLTGKVRVKV